MTYFELCFRANIEKSIQILRYCHSFAQEADEPSCNRFMKGKPGTSRNADLFLKA